MGWFSKNVEPTLDEIQDAAEQLAQNALGLFHSVVDDLLAAADQHKHVAAQADAKAGQLSAQIEQLNALSATATDAAAEKVRKAEAVKALVS